MDDSAIACCNSSNVCQASQDSRLLEFSSGSLVRQLGSSVRNRFQGTLARTDAEVVIIVAINRIDYSLLRMGMSLNNS